MFMWVGCVADSHEYSRWFGDDIAVRSASYEVDWTGVPYAVFLLRSLGYGRPLPQRIKVAGRLLSNPRGNLTAMITSHCSSAALFASRLGFGDDVCGALPFGFERWDGQGLPAGASGEQLPMAMRITQVADIAEVLHRRHGLDACIATVRERRGGWFDPQVAEAFAANAEALLDLPDDVWQLAVAEAPGAQEAVTEAQLDDLVMALGDFVDLKSPYTLGHSRAVAGLVGVAARHAGLTRAEQGTLRRAGHLHDIGRIGVSNLVWDKPDPLTAAERERMQLHPFLSGSHPRPGASAGSRGQARRQPPRAAGRLGLPEPAVRFGPQPVRPALWLPRTDFRVSWSHVRTGRRCRRGRRLTCCGRTPGPATSTRARWTRCSPRPVARRREAPGRSA